MNTRSDNVMDPSEWVKPKQQRPARRSLYAALRKEANIKCLILTGLIYGCIVAIIWCRVTRITKVDIDFTAFPITSTREISPCDDGTIYIPTAFVVMLYLLYLVECWHCKAWHQLKFEKTDLNSAYQKIHEVRHAQPVVWWKAVCYHYVRRTREITRYRNGNAYTCTQVYYERVNSHVSAGCFFFALCGMKDVSRELIDLEKHAATKIQLSKGFLFANHATAREFQEQRAAFFQEQERYDDYMEMREGMDLSNVHFKDSLISWASPDNPPWFAKIPVFWLCNFLLLSWPLRLILELNTAHVHYQVNKLFGVNYMSPSGSEMLLSAPRSHGLPINNHQCRISNRAVSSHHSRLNSGNGRRRRSVVAAASREDIDHDDSTPLLLQSEEEHHPQQQESQHQRTHYQHSHSEKDPNDFLCNSFKNVNEDQQSNNNNECSNSSSNNNNNDTSPSSSGGIVFPHWRSSFFSRNFRFARDTGCKLTRSVTLLMTKPERLEFLANTRPHHPNEYGYFQDERATLLQQQDEENGLYYASNSSSPPPPFLTPSPEEEGEIVSSTNHSNGDRDMRLTYHEQQQFNHEQHRRIQHNQRPSSFEDDVGSSLNCLAPSYSQALLLMEPNERASVTAYFRNGGTSSTGPSPVSNNPSSSTSLEQPPPPFVSFHHLPTGRENERGSVTAVAVHSNSLVSLENNGRRLDSNLTNEHPHQLNPSGISNVNGIGNDEEGRRRFSLSNPPGSSFRAAGDSEERSSLLVSAAASDGIQSSCEQNEGVTDGRSSYSSGAHYLSGGNCSRSIDSSQNNCPSGTSTTTGNPSYFPERKESTNLTNQFSQAPLLSASVNSERGGDDGNRLVSSVSSLGFPQDYDLRLSQEGSSTTLPRGAASGQQHRQQYNIGPSTSSSITTTTTVGHHYLPRTCRLVSSESSMVLNQVAPRQAAGVQIDLTQPVIVTVPRDPLGESSIMAATGTSSGTGQASSTVSTTTSSYSRSRANSRRTNNIVGTHSSLLRHCDADDEPPTYVEALRTSRPVFLPSLARIRRCFTERDIASRFSSNRSTWFDEIADVEGSCDARSSKATALVYQKQQQRNPQPCFSARNNNRGNGSCGGRNTTSRV